MTWMVFVFFWGGCSPTAEDMHEPKASCSPPQWGGGELRDSKESHSLNYFSYVTFCSDKR